MAEPGTMLGIDAQAPADLLRLGLPRSQKVVLVLDLVESVRLMNLDEAGTVARWHDFVLRAQRHAIPGHGGRLVKSLGDGLMVEFERPGDAVNAAFALHGLMKEVNTGSTDTTPELQMQLRAGINSSYVYTDQIDIYGAGVNLAARLVTLAGPEETVVSTSVRDGLTDGLDADVEDMGGCFLRHIDQPVRAYRVRPRGAAKVLAPALETTQPSLQPTIAVIPFASRGGDTELFAIGELIADAVIHQLGKSGALRVVSRLSTTALRGRASAADDAQVHLGAGYVLSGSYVVHNGRVMVFAELADSATRHVVWTDRLQADVQDLLQTDSEIGNAISGAAAGALLSSEVHKATVQPLPNLQSYSLMLGAITLMHRATSEEFRRSRDMLDRLHELHGRHAQPLAWLGMWYVLRVAQGWSNDPERDANEALSYCERALGRDSRSALAIAVTGQVHGYLKKDLHTAARMYEDALVVNPNEPLAWLWMGMTAAFRGEGPAASDATERALVLSPLDPLRYYYQSLAASASIAAGRYERAIELASASLRANRIHSSTYRALAIAQSLCGKVDDARVTVRQLLTLEPQFTVRSFLARYPGQEQARSYAEMLADALRAAGLPP